MLPTTLSPPHPLCGPPARSVPVPALGYFFLLSFSLRYSYFTY